MGGFPDMSGPKAKAAALDGFDLTEDGIGLAFTKAHQDLLRYDHSVGAWFQWTGKVWRKDETRLAFSWARRVCRETAKEAQATGKQLAILAKASTAAAVERFAQSDPALAVTSAIWDRDPYLLGTPGGTLDLRNGKLRDAVREDHITKLTGATPSDTADCPLWREFLKQVTANDEGMIRFLQQWCGYCLTGDITEHALLFAHGPGGNGKGVFLNTVAKAMGDYAATAAMDTFTASQTDRHPTDLAMLRGARLVTASETEEGRAWAESRIKTMTGGDRIRARFMRQDFFEYDPQFKLMIIGNHKPVLRNVDDAARRRFNMVPFVFKPPVKDTKLEEKLHAEWPGILRWMIDGCLDWQKNGLLRPEIVTKATAEYFGEQDIVQQWIEDACERGSLQFDTTAVLFRSWTDHAVANGEKPGTSKWFSQTLARLGYEAVKNTPGQHGKRGFKGISVRLAKDRTERGQTDDGYTGETNPTDATGYANAMHDDESMPDLLRRPKLAGLALLVDGDSLVLKGPRPREDLIAEPRAGRDDMIRTQNDKARRGASYAAATSDEDRAFLRLDWACADHYAGRASQADVHAARTEFETLRKTW